MLEGIRRCGDLPELRAVEQYDPRDNECTDAAVFYGLESNLPRVFADYKAIGRAVYVDLGYWGRRQGGRWEGYHKLVINARHPSAYFRTPRHSPARALELGIRPAPWRSLGGGGHILLAGMGDKAARAEGLQVEEWERWAIEEIRRHTSRPIVYRPKPSWKRARPLPGAYYSPRDRDVVDDLRGCWAVVTHHSNVAVDALVAGIPAFCWAGVAACMASQDLSQIEQPFMPEGREQWIADIAHTQFSVEEMRSGVAWAHLRKEGLI